MKTFVFDIDGVLADFIKGFMTLAASKYHGVPVYSTFQQKSWSNFAGLTAEQEVHVWKLACQSPTFWSSLPPLTGPGTFTLLQKLNLQSNLYFATSRVGNDPLHQSKVWLEEHGIFRPNVVVTKRKGEFCRVVNATYAIDDKADNASAIAWLSEREGDPSRTIPYLITRPYNQYDELAIGSKYVCRVGSVDEFINICFQAIERG